MCYSWLKCYKQFIGEESWMVSDSYSVDSWSHENGHMFCVRIAHQAEMSHWVPLGATFFLLNGNVLLNGKFCWVEFGETISPIELRTNLRMSASIAGPICRSFNFWRKCHCIHLVPFRMAISPIKFKCFTKFNLAKQFSLPNGNILQSWTWWDVSKTRLKLWIHIWNMLLNVQHTLLFWWLCLNLTNSIKWPCFSVVFFLEHKLKNCQWTKPSVLDPQIL